MRFRSLTWKRLLAAAAILALAVGLVPIAQRAWAAALAGSPFTIETLMSIAAVGAVLIGAAEEAAVVVMLFLIGELLEGFAAGRARDGIRALTSLVPKTAWLDRDGAMPALVDYVTAQYLVELPTESIRLGWETIYGLVRSTLMEADDSDDSAADLAA